MNHIWPMGLMFDTPGLAMVWGVNLLRSSYGNKELAHPLRDYLVSAGFWVKSWYYEEEWQVNQFVSQRVISLWEDSVPPFQNNCMCLQDWDLCVFWLQYSFSFNLKEVSFNSFDINCWLWSPWYACICSFRKTWEPSGGWNSISIFVNIKYGT